MWSKTRELVTVNIPIELIEYSDNPVPQWEARCEHLQIVAEGQTPEIAKENLIQLLENKQLKSH